VGEVAEKGLKAKYLSRGSSCQGVSVKAPHPPQPETPDGDHLWA